MSSPLPWNLTFDGPDYVLTDADGETVYCGPDSDAVTDLYRVAGRDQTSLRAASDAELLTEVSRRMREGTR